MAKRKLDDRDIPQAARPQRKSSRLEQRFHEKPPGREGERANISKASNMTAAPKASSIADTKHAPSEVTLSVQEKMGDLFDPPPNTVIVQACNTVGRWGAGIATEFKKRFPSAFSEYQQHCRDASPENITGTAQLIAPRGEDRLWIGNLFTSSDYGKRKDSRQSILGKTAPAMENLLVQIATHNRQVKTGKIEHVWMCKINSGHFGVDWEDTRAALEKVKVPKGLDLEGVVLVTPD